MMDINSWMFHLPQVNEAPAGSIVACAISSMEGSELGNLVAYPKLLHICRLDIYLRQLRFVVNVDTYSICLRIVSWLGDSFVCLNHS